MSLVYLFALSGILLGVAFPPSPFGWVAFVAYVPVLIAIDQLQEGVRRRAIIGNLYATFFLYHGITNWWVLSWQEQTDPYLMASGAALWLGHPFFLSLPFYALASIRRRLGRRVYLWSAPLAIAGFEWLHGQTDASYPWLTTGYDLLSTPFVQVADWIGVYGLSLLIVVVNALIASWYVARSTEHASRTPLYAAVGLLAVWLGASVAHHSAVEGRRTDGTLTVSLVQPNENPWDKWTDPRKQVATHIAMVNTARQQGALPDVVVWSETAIPFTIREAPYQPEMARLQHWVDTSSVTLLTGFADRMIYPVGEAPPSARTSSYDPNLRYDHFNASMTIDPDRGVTSIHRKSMLTPFAERLPFADQLSFAMSWIEWGVGISAWGKGRTRDPQPILRDGDTIARIGTIICIESIYPEVARDMVNNGADLLCVITNDAWYNGTWGPEQHYHIARMRAIEQRRDLIRCAMSGETGVITLEGGSRARIPALTQDVLTAEAHPSSQRTLYAVVGDVVPPAGLFVTLLLLIGARFPSVVRKLRVRTKH